MSIEINLSPTLVDQLQIQAALLGITQNELAEKLLYQGLSKQLGQENELENHTEMTCRDFLLSISGTFSSRTSDTSANVKSIVTDMLLQKYRI